MEMLPPVAAAAEALRVSYIRFEPQYINDFGRATGEVIEDFRLVLAEAGYGGVFTEVPVPLLRDSMANGKFDVTVINSAIAGVTEGQALPSKEAIGVIELLAFFRDTSEPPGQAEMIRGKRLIFARGYGYGGKRAVLTAPERKNEVVMEVNDIPTGIAALRRGLADYFLHYRRNVEHAMEGDALADLRWSYIDVLPIHIVVSRTRPDAAALLHALEASLVRLREQGRLPPRVLPKQ